MGNTFLLRYGKKHKSEGIKNPVCFYYKGHFGGLLYPFISIDIT